MWAKEHINCSENQWKQTIWSDECKILLFGCDGQKYVRRRVGEELHPDCIEGTTKNPTSVMIWACMSADGVDHIQVIDDILNTKKKKKKIHRYYPGTQIDTFHKGSVP